MKVAISINHAEHQQSHGDAIKSGLAAHGIESVFMPVNTVIPGADIHAVWGAPTKHPAICAWINKEGGRMLIFERGHVGDRMNWTSVGWDGLGNRGRYARVEDGGERWRKHWVHLWEPWTTRHGTAVVLGQCAGDASLYGLKEGIESWATQQCQTLKQAGYQVRYRAHPNMKRRGALFCPATAQPSPNERLTDDLRWASLAVTYNSTSGVEAVLAGVPTVTMDEGAMAWAVSGHTIFDRIQPERDAWTQWISWTQYTLEEIRNGFFWTYLEGVG